MNSNSYVIWDFGSEWCAPCKMLDPILTEILSEYPSITLQKFDVNKEFVLSRKLGITGIPTLLFIKNDEVVGKLVGLQPKQYIINAIKNSFNL